MPVSLLLLAPFEYHWPCTVTKTVTKTKKELQQIANFVRDLSARGVPSYQLAGGLMKGKKGLARLVFRLVLVDAERIDFSSVLTGEKL